LDASAHLKPNFSNGGRRLRFENYNKMFWKIWSMQKSSMQLLLPTMHCQNAGWTRELQHQQHSSLGLGLDGFHLNLIGKFNFIFSI